MAEWIGAIAGAVAATVAVIGLLIGRHHRRSSARPDNPSLLVDQPVDALAPVPRQREKASPFWIPFLVIHVLLVWRIGVVVGSSSGTSDNGLWPDVLAFFLALAAVAATVPICARVWRTKRVFTALVAVLVVMPLLSFDVLMLVGITIALAE